MKTHHRLLPVIAIACWAGLSNAEPNRTEANRVIEIEFRSEIQYENPFTEIELDVIVTQPNGKELRVPGFWAGGDRWCFRYASDQLGKHTWRMECTDRNNAKLHGATVRFTAEVLPNGTIQPPKDVELVPGKAEVTVVQGVADNGRSGWPDWYFGATAGKLAGEEFQRPDQGELPQRDTW